MTISGFIITLKTYYQDVIVCSVVLSVAWVMLYSFIAPPITTMMIKKLFSDDADHGLIYKWTKYEDISPYLKVCALASEDQNLPFHYGIDIEAIENALAVNKKGRKTFGASTITQQVAKNAFLFPARNFIRKGLEVYFGILIEVIWSKERILETYLNIAEMGPKVFGVGAAAQYYYKKSAIKLSLQESAGIIAILPNPVKYNLKKPGPYISERRGEITSLFYQLDGTNYLRELYIKSEESLYDFKKYKK